MRLMGKFRKGITSALILSMGVLGVFAHAIFGQDEPTEEAPAAEEAVEQEAGAEEAVEQEAGAEAAQPETAAAPEATSQEDASATEEAPAEEQSGGEQADPNSPQEDLEVTDLNEPVTEEMTPKWESSTPYQAKDVTSSVAVENIIEPAAEYHYASFGKPNPFLPPEREAKDTGMVASMTPSTPDAAPSMDATTPATPGISGNTGATPQAGTEIPVISALQNYPLSLLELKGVWLMDNGERRAIVMTPNKEGIIVKVNDPISAGKVLEIKKDHLIVRQYRLRKDGVREFSDESLYLGDAKRPNNHVVRLVPGSDPVFMGERSTPPPVENAAEPGDSDTSTVPEPVAAPAPAGNAANSNPPVLGTTPVPFGGGTNPTSAGGGATPNANGTGGTVIIHTAPAANSNSTDTQKTIILPATPPASPQAGAASKP